MAINSLPSISAMRLKITLLVISLCGFTGCASTAPRLLVLDATTDLPIADAKVIASPFPSIYPFGMPKNREYHTDSSGIVTLDRLPTGFESMVSVSGESSLPLCKYYENFESTLGEIKVLRLDK